MLKFSVGYQYDEDMPFSDVVCDYREKIDEVYFSWTDCASGRSMIGGYDGYFDYSLQNTLICELKKIRSMGVKLDLLFNATCYGEDSMCEVLRGKV